MKQIYDQFELSSELRFAGNKLVVVAFTSGKCGPCRLTTPFLESLCPQMPDVLFIKIDVNESEDFVELFKITGIPAFYFFRNNVKQRFTFPIFKDVAKLCRSIDGERIDRQLCSSLGV